MSHSDSVERDVLLPLSPVDLVSGGPATHVGLPNPAAVYCIEQDGRYMSVQTPEGETGVCRFADGREIDAWGFFRER